jgi:hypothetical protein
VIVRACDGEPAINIRLSLGPSGFWAHGDGLYRYGREIGGIERHETGDSHSFAPAPGAGAWHVPDGAP